MPNSSPTTRWQRLKRWWAGELKSSDDPQVFMMWIERPWLREKWDALAEHWGKHWKFWLGILAAVLTAWAFK
jgi:hypothetical protein